MAWYIDSTRIIMQKLSGDSEQIIPRLQPLTGGTELQFFGYENEVTKAIGKVVGESDLSTIKDMRKDAALHAITGPQSFNTSYYVKGVHWTRDKAQWQTIRPDLDCDTPVFTVEIELYV
jgi:hypothetical protein